MLSCLVEIGGPVSLGAMQKEFLELEDPGEKDAYPFIHLHVVDVSCVMLWGHAR